MTDAPTQDEHRLSKLRFRAWRRGFRELDLILGGYADRHGAAFGETEFSDFEALLEANDTDVYIWIIGQEPVPAAYDTPLMAALKAFRPNL